VPVLAHMDADGQVRSVYESLICDEYLEETHPEPRMLPGDPVARAHARIIIDRFNSKYVPVFYRFLIRCLASALRTRV
jgi:glutathione S-transferase